ncbi:MAG: peptidoglycan DD-metalloendopeptidase family protein [Bacilli bacterium]|nr:peptidoglycan DD-metalloendopeptidase family protein [Bacilli bacterium]MBP3635538.1 peptidoglycan DD-metalloendopeptidase family protein [Bacilli bacterium]
MIRYLRLLFIVMFIFVLFPISANAKTLGQLKQEYDALEKKYSSTGSSIKATESEIASAKARIESIYTELDQAQKEIQSITNEISKLNESIFEKDKQTKELMKFFQVSQGESTYLEYIFSADSITDFIYRITITEQLSKYNDKLIDEMNSMIEKNNKNIENLHVKEESLKKLQEELGNKLVVLSSERESLYDEYSSLEEDIKNSKTIIDYYIKAGCTENQDISSCAKEQLPPGTKFWRPVTAGCITSNFGLRVDPFQGVYRTHSGMDIACRSLSGGKIYSISDGQVVTINNVDRGGYGKYIIIHHRVNGQNYSSLYGHLEAIYVSKGDIVNKDTVIGYMGSTGRSTGPHLHLNVCHGLNSCMSTSVLTNPRNYINFPFYDGIHYSYFYDRTSYYK